MQTSEETLSAGAAEAPQADLQLPLSAPEAEPVDGAAEAKAEEPKPEDPAAERRRIEEQLEALKRREAELRRALATASHPQLADAIRQIEGRAYALSRVEAKMAEGLSKSEERRKGTLEKKRASLQEKRAELDAQIAELDKELDALGVDRTRAFELERREAMEQLIAVLGEHGAAIQAAGLEASNLVPEIVGWLPEIKTLAQSLAKPNSAN